MHTPHRLRWRPWADSPLSSPKRSSLVRRPLTPMHLISRKCISVSSSDDLPTTSFLRLMQLQEEIEAKYGTNLCVKMVPATVCADDSSPSMSSSMSPLPELTWIEVTKMAFCSAHGILFASFLVRRYTGCKSPGLSYAWSRPVCMK